MVMPYHLHMPSYFLETFTEYPYNNEKIISMLAAKEEEVLNGKLTSFVAAKKLLDAYFSTLK